MTTYPHDRNMVQVNDAEGLNYVSRIECKFIVKPLLMWFFALQCTFLERTVF